MYRKIYAITVLLTLLFSQSVFAQDSKVLAKDADENYSFEKVYEVAGKSKADIFAAIKSWVIKT